MSKNVKQPKNETPEEVTQDNSETTEAAEAAEAAEATETTEATEQESILNSEEPIIDTKDEVVDTANEAESSNDAGISGEIFSRIAQLEEQVIEYKEQSLRLQAEMANIKRRAESSVEKAHKFGIEKLARELIPVIDSLEKGIETAEKTDENQHSSFVEGLNLVLKQLLGTLEKFEIKQIDPISEPFDPHYHQAVATVDKPETEPNTVVEVCQKGCKLHNRVLRPAMVIVSAK